MRKIRETLLLIALALLSLPCVTAQTRPKPDLIPDKLMDAELPALDDAAPIRLALYKNRVAVIILWASWCGPCTMAVEKLNRLNKELAARGVEVIGLTLEDPKADVESVRTFVRNSKISFQIGWINEELLKALTSQASIPQLYVIAGDRVIVKRIIGWSSSRMPALLLESVDQALTNPPNGW